MHESFIRNPIFEDVAICFEKVLGIEIRSSVELNQDQLNRLNHLFDPASSEALNLLNSRSIKKVVISKPAQANDRGILAEREEETNQVVLFLPVTILNDAVRDAAFLLLGALSP